MWFWGNKKKSIQGKVYKHWRARAQSPPGSCPGRTHQKRCLLYYQFVTYHPNPGLVFRRCRGIRVSKDLEVGSIQKVGQGIVLVNCRLIYSPSIGLTLLMCEATQRNMILDCYSKLPQSTLLLFLLASLSLKVISAIRLASIEIPPVVAAGDVATLVCDVDLESDDLYSVKWYKDGEEFYRFSPRRDPPIQMYHVEGVHIDRTRSRGERVILRTLTTASSGFYRCEASAEAPSFSSVQGGGPLVVVIPPKRKPEIFGGIEGNETDEVLDLNCSTDASRPAASIHWLINGVQVDADFAQLSSVRWKVTGLEASVSSLRIPLKEKKYFTRSGPTTVTCQATIETTSLIQSSEEDIETSLSAWVSSDSGPPAFTSSSALQKVSDVWVKQSAQESENLRNLHLTTSITVNVNNAIKTFVDSLTILFAVLYLYAPKLLA